MVKEKLRKQIPSDTLLSLYAVVQNYNEIKYKELRLTRECAPFNRLWYILK